MRTFLPFVFFVCSACAAHKPAPLAPAPEKAPETAAPATTAAPPPSATAASPDAAQAASGNNGAPAVVAPPAPDKAIGKSVAVKAASKDHTVDGRALLRIGGGARVVAGTKWYDATLWVDDVDGKRAFPALAMRAGGRDKARLVHGDHAPAFVIWGRFNKQLVIHFAKAVSAKELRDDMSEALEADKNRDAFLAILGDAAAGDEWLLTTKDNGELQLDAGGETKTTPPSPKLVRAVWSIWLGPKALAPELRQSLIGNIDLLGR
ncbi:MAG TPA: hypothetical protein VIA18_33580 [Polyangia bacterium]|nr:hypothetical protein [Polyangia bacterium]